MWESGQELEAEARKAAKENAGLTAHMTLSPAALKRRLAAKKKKAREAKAKAAANG